MELDSLDRSADYCQKITRSFPELDVRTATLNQEGQYNDVLIVNDALIFRFPKVPAAVATLRTEAAVLRALRNRLPLTIPNPIYHNVEAAAVGEAFAGYQMIPGRPLWREAFAKIGDAGDLRRMAVQLAQFLHELHAIPAERLIPVSLPRYETREEWTSWYARVRESLYPRMRPEAREMVTSHFDSYFGADRHRLSFEPHLRHGDFGTGNIIYDPERCSVVGVIDFGSIGLGDPACDFAGLLSSYGEAFYELCAQAYPAMAESLDRARFYLGTFALQEALFGFENGDDEAYRAGMATYV